MTSKLSAKAQTWLNEVFDQSGIRCGTCQSWRPLKGSEIEWCANCGDDAYDTIETAHRATIQGIAFCLPPAKIEITKAHLLKDARRIIKNIDQLFTDCAHWNRLHPDEKQINADPDAMLAKEKSRLLTEIDQLEGTTTAH